MRAPLALASATAATANVVQSGRQVGEEYMVRIAASSVSSTDLGFTVLFTAQGDANPEQEQRAEQTQAPDLEQFGGEQGERDAQAHGDDDLPQDRLAPRSGAPSGAWPWQ